MERLRSLFFTAVLAAAVLSAAGPVRSDGVREINQACVASGCFAGDNPGFPVEIVVSGAYRLSSNLTTGSNVAAIQVTADRVDLDLNGFTVQGPNACSDTGSAITCTFNDSSDLVLILGSHVVIHDGFVQGAMGRGIFLASGIPHVVRRVHVTQSGSAGIIVVGFALVEECSASLNAGRGFWGDVPTRFNGNYAAKNGSSGFIGGSCQDNTSTENYDLNFVFCTDLGGNSQ